MDKDQELKNDILDSISNSFHSESPRSFGLPNNDGITGWGNQKASILGSSIEKAQIRPQKIVIKSVDKGFVRPVSSNTVPTSLESSPIRKFFVRAASKENKRFKMDTEKKSLYESDYSNTGMDEIKAQLKAFSSKNYLWLSDKPPPEAADKYFDTDKRDSLREELPYTFQKDTFSRLLLKAADSKGMRSTNTGSPFLTKVSDMMGVTRIRIPKPAKDLNKTTSSNNSAFATIGHPSKRKISNKSFYNASISYSRKTFMGMSMITPNNITSKEIPPASDPSSTLHQKKSSLAWQVHPQAPVQGQSSSHFQSTMSAFPQVANLTQTSMTQSYVPLLNQTQTLNVSQIHSQTMSNSPSGGHLTGDVGNFQYYAQRLGSGGSKNRLTEMSGSGRSSPPILHAKRNVQKMKGIATDFFKDEKSLTSASTKRVDEVLLTNIGTRDVRSQSVKIQRDVRKKGKITKGIVREVSIQPGAQLNVTSIGSSNLFSIIGGKVGSRQPFQKIKP